MEYQKNQNNHHMPAVYVILGAVFVTIVTIAVLTVLGYRLNFGKNQVDVVGRLQLQIMPTGAKVTVDGKELSWLDGSSISLTEGMHTIDVRKDGYNPWQDQVQIGGSRVKWLSVRLFANNISPAIVKNYPSLLGSSAAPHHNFIINHLAKNEFELVDLTSMEPKFLAIKLADYYEEADKFEFGFRNWNLENDNLIFQDPNSADGRTILVNYKKPKATVDLTARYANQQLGFRNFEIVGANRSILWLLEQGNLFRINLAASDLAAELIAERVQAFSAIDDSKIAFIQHKEEAEARVQILKMYNFKELSTVVVDEATISDVVNITSSRISSKDCLMYLKNNRLMILQADDFYGLKQSDNKDDIFQGFLTANPKVKMTFSKYFNQQIRLINQNNDQYIMLATQASNVSDQAMIFSGVELFVYDLDNEEAFQFSDLTARDIATVSVQWLDKVIFWQSNLDGKLLTRYYNGRNQLLLEKIMPKHQLRFDKSQKNLYYLADGASGVDLMRAKVTE